MPTDDLAAQMVREMGLDSWFIQDEIKRCEAIARRYIEKALFDQRAKVELEHLVELKKFQREADSQAEEIERLRERISNLTGRQTISVVDQHGKTIGVQYKSFDELLRHEAFVDEHGTAWTIPTASAYHAVCVALKAAQEVGRG